MTEGGAGLKERRSGDASNSRALVAGMVKRAAKAGFAAADLVLGRWPGPRILIYHEVGAGTALEMDVGLEAFARQVDWLEAKGRVIGLDDALAAPDGESARTAFVLTFDDGYRSLYRHAYPLLRERGLPFTLYLATESIDTGRPFAAGGAPLDWDQVGEMVDSGLVTVGAHTHRHRDLRELSVSEVEDELGTSDELIEKHTGVAPRHFAYPKGYWAPDAEPVVRRRYATAVLGAGHPVTGTTDPHRIHRLPVQQSDGYFFFVRKLRTGMRLEEWARSRIKGYRNPPVERNGAR